jgi:hypothetical protein
VNFTSEARERPPDNLSACDSAHDKEGLGPFCNRIGQGSIKWIVRDVFPAGKESHQRPALFCFVIADGAAQHWIFFFNRVDYRAHRRRAVEIDVYFITHLRERAKMMRKNDANHEIETAITKTQVPNKFQTTMSKNGKTGSRLIWDLIIGTCLEFGAWDLTSSG